MTLLRHRARLRIPDRGRVLGDGAVAGEFSRAGHVEDGLARPAVRVGIQLDQPLVRIQVGLEVRQMHVMVAVRQERVAQGSKDSWLVTAEMVREDEVQRRPRFRIVFVVRLWPLLDLRQVFAY